MKQINFNQAYEKVGEIAESVGKDYWSVQLSKTPLEDVKISGYIDGYTWTKDCNNLKDLFIAVNNMVGVRSKTSGIKVINVK